MRQLAHIEKIVAINPIPTADMIEVATVLGWECVIAKKDNFKVGDFVIYIEVDSIVPEKPEFEFLRERKFRVRTIKLKKQISQGLILPISYLDGIVNPKEGLDVTTLLGITKYDPEVQSEKDNQVDYVKQNALSRYLFKYKWYRNLFKTKSDNFPSWIQKTDEERIQSFPSVLERFKDKTFYVTEKIDYQSVTFFTKTKKNFFGFKTKEFGVCSRNKLVTNKSSLYWKIAEKYNLEKIMKSYKKDLVIQGEQGDTKIQSNKYKITEPKMWIFNIVSYDGDKRYNFNYNEMEEFITDTDLQLVPLLDSEFKLKETVKDMVDYSKGKSVVNQKTTREGVVIRCIEKGSKILSFKVINPEFLLENGE